MSNEIYYMTKLDGGSGVYKMTKSKADGGWEVYMMRRPDSTLPEGGGGGGGETENYTWTLYPAFDQWNGNYANPSWNETIGSYTDYYLIYTIVDTKYTHVKVVAKAGSDGYWFSDDSKYMASIGVKTLVAYDVCGEGGSLTTNRTTYANAAAAIAAWPGSTTRALKLGADRKMVMGFQGGNGTKTCLFSIYLGYAA